MFTLQELTQLLGWCTIINMAVMVISSSAIILCRGFITGIHGRMFGLEPAKVSALYFQYLAQYKLLIIVFNLVPWIALKLM